MGQLFSPGIEPGTFCVLDRCDNRYTTKTSCYDLDTCEHGNVSRRREQEVNQNGGQLSTTWLCGRDRLVVRTLRCGRSNPGSNPGHGNFEEHKHKQGI